MSSKSSEDQKKSSPKIEQFFSLKSSEDPKKKLFSAIWNYIQPEFVGFIDADMPFSVWSSSTQISMGEC